MAEGFSFTCLGKICDIVRGGIGDCLVAPIRRQFTYMCCFNSNITELEIQLKELETTRQGVQMGVDENRRKARFIDPNVVVWLTRVNEVTTEVEKIIQDKAKVKEGCLNRWCPNLKLRYSLSWKAVKKTKVVVDLQVASVQYTQSSACLLTRTNRDFVGFESRRLYMEEIIKALKHDEINLIGVCGMGGVGKTTLVKEVAKIAKEDNHFHEVAMAAVSQKPNLTNVQACIAEMLGLKNLRDTESPIVRADLLRTRLLQDNKKVLVILDDIWVEFDLQAMGFPLEGADKNFKMLYTSRTRGLWDDIPTKKDIPLVILSKDEAWQLFREKVGDSADARDLQPIAKQLVNECGCLPLALVLLGSALSKKSGRNTIKEIWEDTLGRLTCSNHLYSRLELTYEYLEDEEAKRLFLLCCLFQEDEDIRLEDLARYGFGLSLFDGLNQMGKVRHRVFLIVDDLKSRYLLLDSEKEECVRVHDMVRDMGLSIASRDKVALVIHGAISQWPKMATREHYTAISVVSNKIEELPNGLTYPNLEFLMLQCPNLEFLPPNIFEGMKKLKVLELNSFDGFLTLQSLRNLTTLSLEGFRGVLDNVSLYGNLLNLEILNFRNSKIKELPEEIGELVNLRLLDLTNTKLLNRIPPDVISRLVHLEELHSMGSKFIGWEGEGNEEGRNANLREFEFLHNLNTLKIQIRAHVHIPELPIFSKLENSVVGIINTVDSDYDSDDDSVSEALILIPLDGRGIDSLSETSDSLVLQGTGCNDLVRELQLRGGVDGIQQLKILILGECDTPECLANTMNPVYLPTTTVRSKNKPTAPVLATAVFPALRTLHLNRLPNLREICRGPVPSRSLGELTSIQVHNCERLENLFQLPIVGCLTQVKRLFISSCGMMEEVISKEHQEDIHVATNRIVFPKLEVLKLVNLPSLVCFCRGIDQIDFPQLKKLCLKDIPQVNHLFHNNSNLSSTSERNNNVGFLSLFPQKVSLPNLEVLDVSELDNLERLGHPPLSAGSLSKLKECSVRHCGKLLCAFPSQFLPMLQELQELTVKSCHLLEVVFQLEGLVPSNILQNLQKLCVEGCPKIESVVFKNEKEEEAADDSTLIIPQLWYLRISEMEKLKSFYSSSTTSNAQSLFNHQVSLPNLEVLDVSELENLERLGHRPLSAGSLSELRKVSVRHCSKLLCVFPPQFLPMLQELQELTVKNCHSLEVVFQLEGLVPSNILQNLQELCVEGCPKIESVVFKNEKEEEAADDSTLIIPELRYLRISEMEKLKSFYSSSTTSNAQSLFNHQVSLPNLEVLDVSELENLERLGHRPLSAGSLSKLKEFSVRRCGKLLCVFPSQFLPMLQELRELTVKSCHSLEVVFQLEGLVHSNILKNLQKLCVEDCPKIESVVFKNEKEEEAADDSTLIIPELRYLGISEMEKLKSFYSSSTTSNAQSLFNHQVSLPNLEVLDVSELENLERLGHRPLSEGSLSKLKQFSVHRCGKLLCVFQPQFLPMLRELQELSVKSCHSLEVVFQLEGLVPSNMLQNLQRLCVEDCPKIKSVVFKNEKEEAADNSTLIIPQLRYLRISEMENLKSFYSSSTASNAQSLFNNQVSLPKLEVLDVSELENLERLGHHPLSEGSLSKLKQFSVHRCGKLLCVFPPQFLPILRELQELTVKSCHSLEVVFQLEGLVPSNILQNLQKLCVEGCPEIESVVFKNEKDEPAADDSTLIIPQLRYLRISEMENLKSFYSSSTASNAQSLFNDQVSLPNLEVLDVSELENLERLGHGPLSADSLSKLKELSVRRCGKLLCVFPSQVLPMLRELQELTVKSCHSLEVVFPLEGLVLSDMLQNLQMLCVEGCPKIEFVVFKNEKEAVDDPLIISQLRYLRISDTENLKSFYSSSTTSNAQSLFNNQVMLPVLEVFEVDRLGNIVEIWDKQSPWLNENTVSFKLREMKVQQCKKLMNLVPSNILPRLQNLQKLCVEGCPKIESIVFKNGKEEEAADDSSLIDNTMFPRLSKLELCHLRKLKMFSPLTHPLELPLLSEMAICDCPSMDSFSLGHVSIPNLSLKGISRNDSDGTKNQEDEEPKNG